MAERLLEGLLLSCPELAEGEEGEGAILEEGTDCKLCVFFGWIFISGILFREEDEEGGRC